MEELNLIELLNFYLKKSPIIIITTILACIIGLIYVFYIQTPMYHGETSIILVERYENEASITQSDLTVNEKLVSTYSEIIKSRRVLEQVIEKLKLNYTTEELADKINVTSLSNTSIIKVVVSDEDSRQASEIANTIALVFSTEVMDIYNLENVSVLDKAIEEEAPYNINIPKQLIIYIIIGFIIGCLIIFAMYYFSDTISSKKEIEMKIKLPVIAEVPLANKNTLDDTSTNKSKVFDTVDRIEKNQVELEKVEAIIPEEDKKERKENERNYS